MRFSLFVLLALVFSFTIQARNVCKISRYYAIDSFPDLKASGTYRVVVDSAEDCFLKAISFAEKSDLPFYKIFVNRFETVRSTGVLYFHWSFNDSYIFDSKGSVSKYSKKCLKKEGITNIKDYINDGNLLYKEDCSSFDHY